MRPAKDTETFGGGIQETSVAMRGYARAAPSGPVLKPGDRA